VALIALLPAPAAADAADHRFGTWDCALPDLPLGRLTLSATGYRLEGTAHLPSGQGAVSWTSDAFGLSGGPLERFTLTSGLVYTSPDPARPGVMVDLYSGRDAAVHCLPVTGG
jgi:hypothetical protein